MLGIEYPIFQGGMAWIADADLAAAVSNAGGLGIIAAGNADTEYVRGQVRKAKEMTNKPFGLNIMLLSPFADEIAQMVVEEDVKVVTTGAGNAGKYMSLWNEAGVKVIPVVPSVTFAKMAARTGAFAVIAEGGESGGHIGELATMTLVPQVCDAVDLPVIAAGGIADGRGIAAALSLGAEAVQLGTRFLSAKECNIHENYRKKVFKAGDTATVVTGRRLGHPVRSIKNQFAREYGKIGAFSGAESFIRNIAFMLMVSRMVNVISESGTYWVANSFIWTWLLLPTQAMYDVVKKETAGSKENIKVSKPSPKSSCTNPVGYSGSEVTLLRVTHSLF